MRVIFDAAHDNGLAVKVRKDPTEVAMESLPQGGVAEERAAIFGGEDRVNEDFGERLWHDEE